MAIGNNDPNCGAVEIGDALSINRRSEEYRLGVAQMREWHERCRAKRLGIKRKPLSTHSVNAANHLGLLGTKGGAK